MEFMYERVRSAESWTCVVNPPRPSEGNTGHYISKARVNLLPPEENKEYNGTLSQLSCAAATHASIYGEQTGSLSCGSGPLIKTDSRGRPLDGTYEGRSIAANNALLVRAPQVHQRLSHLYKAK